LRKIPANSRRISAIAFLADRESLVAAEQDGPVECWQLGSGDRLWSFDVPNSELTAVAIDPGGKYLVTLDADGTTQRWRLGPHPKLVKTVKPPAGRADAIALAPDGRASAWVGEKCEILVRDPSTGQTIRSLNVPHSGLSCLCFSPDARLLAGLARSPADHLIWWDIAAGKEITRLPEETFGSRFLAFSPDGRLLASANGGNGDVRFWEIASGKTVLRFVASPYLRALAFAPDGRTIAIGDGSDCAVRIWDATGILHRGALPASPLPARDLAALWNDLAGPDAPQAYRAGWMLTGRPGQTVVLFRRYLTRVSPPDHERIRRLISDLGNRRYAVRRKAVKQLQELGDLAELDLRRVLRDHPALETRKRLEALLARVERQRWLPTGDRLRVVRAVAVLERIGTKDARRLLSDLAGGTPESRLTREARAALNRLSKRPSQPR
jgi:hypothetical protein